MATRVIVLGDVFEFDYDLLEWVPESPRGDPSLVNSTIPNDGPSPSIPNLGLWAIRMLSENGLEAKVLEEDETPEPIPSLIY